MELWPHQKDALEKMHNGSLLVGGTGSGKSLTALSYYVRVSEMVREPPEALYIITTAKKRDEGDWQDAASDLGIDNVTVDSWHNIKKYIKVKKSFFIFDEQRVIGYGLWTKSFLKITGTNRWILLSATPADSWMDLIPVFIANGFYRNKTQFVREHVIYAPYVTFPKIVGYRNEEKLRRYKNQVFVVMKYKKHTTRHTKTYYAKYNKQAVKEVLKTQWNIFTNEPTSSLAEEVFVLRRIINSHPTRVFLLMSIQDVVKKLIIFYNYNFELEILKTWFKYRTTVAEYNGFKHDPIPETEDWVYLVQYNSGSEAWECFSTNHMAFYSLNYSYRTRQQAMGRIDRHNTHYKNLYYYEIVSDSMIDRAISKAFHNKKDFNIRTLNLKPRE